MPNKVDYRTFSQRVKNKYPEYINMGDLELAQMWVNENPQYGEFVVFDQQPVKKKDQAAPSLGAQGGLQYASTGDPIADKAQVQSALKGYSQKKDKSEEIGFWENIGNTIINGSAQMWNGLNQLLYTSSLARAGVQIELATEYGKFARPFKEDYKTKTREQMSLLEESATAFAGSIPVMTASILTGGFAGSGARVAGTLPAFISGFDQSGKEADELGITDPLDRLTFQTLGGTIEGASELIMPDASLIRPLRQRALKEIVRVGAKGFSKADAGRYVAEFSEKVAKEVGEEYAVELGNALRNASFAAAGYDKAAPEMKSARDYAVMTISAAFGAGTFASVGTGVDAAFAKSTAIKKAAENPEAAAQAVADLVDAGKLTQEQADAFLAKVASVNKAISKMPDDVDPDVAVNTADLLNEKVGLEEMVKELEENKKRIDPSFHQGVDDRIAQITTRINELTQQITGFQAPTEQIAPEAPQMAPAEVSPEVGIEIPQPQESVLEGPKMPPLEDLEFDNIEFVEPVMTPVETQLVSEKKSPLIKETFQGVTRPRKKPGEVRAPLMEQVTEGGVFKAKLRDSKTGTEFIVEDPELSLDLAIAAQVRESGRTEFPQPAFLETFSEVVDSDPELQTLFPNILETGQPLSLEQRTVSLDGKKVTRNVAQRMQPLYAALEQRMNNAEEIPMSEIEAVVDQIIQLQQEIQNQKGKKTVRAANGVRQEFTPLTDEQKRIFNDFTDALVNKLLSYDFATTTTTGPTTQKTTTAGLIATPREGRPLLEAKVPRERLEGAEVTIEGRGRGRIAIKPLPGLGERSVYGITFEETGAEAPETISPTARETGTTPAAVGVEPQTEQNVRQETNAPQEGRGQGEDAAPVPQEEGRQEGQVTPPAVEQEGETPPATAKKPRKTEQQKADEGKAILDKLKETLRALKAKPGGGANIDLTFGVVPISKAVWNTAIDTAILAIDAGQSIAQAVKAASDYISSKIDGDWGKAKFEQYMDEMFGQAPLNQQIDDVAESAGISPKNFRDLYRVNRELFGLNQSEAMSAAIAMDKMIDVMAKRAGVSKTEMYGKLNFKKATEQDLPQGAIKQDKEEILRVFHGTSKDKDFKKFKDTGKGVFVTISPKEASEYAEQNDSMKFGDYDPVTRKFREINTASRVIPMNLKLGNSYKLTKADLEFLNSKPNYSALQKELHARIKANGFDTIDYGNGVYAVLTEGRLRSMLTNEVLFQKDLPQGVKFQVDAWHGSPYQFDKFTTDRIGTGEGAQAFGWGLYFTDLKGIAENYANELSPISTEYLLLGENEQLLRHAVLNNLLNKDVSEVLESYYDRHPILRPLPESEEREIYGEEYDVVIKNRKENIDVFNARKNEKFETGRNLYRVSLHKGKTPDQYTWLEWDKPVGEENAKRILDQLKKEGLIEKAEANWSRKNMNGSFSGKESLENDLKNLRGDHLYERFLSPRVTPIAGGLGAGSSNRLFKSAKDTSLFLLRSGIDGNKYPAESIARGTTSETARGFNYVVFDENAISIEKVIKFQEDAIKARGAVMVSMDGRATIYALSDPNVSTPLHELAHVFEHYLTDEERSTVQQWAKTKDWNIKTSESFARGFEKYLAEGKAPTPALQRIFDNFKQWLTEIYNGITGSDIDIELNKPMRDLYAKMFEFTGKDGPSNFEKWKGNNRLLVGAEIQEAKTGEPIVVKGYHGTTNEFYEFDSSVKGSVEGHLGKVNYFTSDYQDAATNYLSEGPDLKIRVENRVDQIMSEFEDNYGTSQINDEDFLDLIPELSKKYGYTQEELEDEISSFRSLARRLAQRELQGGKEKVLDVFIKLNNPVVLGKGSTWFQTLNISESDLEQAAKEVAEENDISVAEAKEDYDYEIRDRAIENSGYKNLAVDALSSALRSNGYRGSNAKRILGDNRLFELEIDLNELERDLRRKDISDLYENEDGEFASSQVVSDFFKNLGFDGIILTDVSTRFRGMGLGGSTSHIHVFDEFSNQIKLADGSNTTFGETRDIRFQEDKAKTTPEAKQEKTIAEQRKEFRETAKKYFEGMKKMGVIFDAERNAAEDIAFIKALTKYIKLEIDNGMVTFKGFVEKTAGMIEDFNDASVKRIARDIWSKEVVKAYPKIYAKLQKAQKALLDKELVEARKELRINLKNLLSDKKIFKQISSLTTERKLDKSSSDILVGIRSEIEALGGIGKLSDEQLISYSELATETYKEGRINQKQFIDALAKEKAETSKNAKSAITNQGERSAFKLKDAEEAREFLAENNGDNSNQVNINNGEVIVESVDDFDAILPLIGKGATFGGTTTSPNPNNVKRGKKNFFRTTLGGGLIYLLDKFKGKKASQETIDFFNNLQEEVKAGTRQKKRLKATLNNQRKVAIERIFRGQARYIAFMLSRPKVNGKRLVIKDNNGKEIKRINVAGVLYYYQLMKDPHFLKKDGNGERKIGLSESSMKDIVDFINLPENAKVRELINIDQLLIKKAAQNAAQVMEANNISSELFTPRTLDLSKYENDTFIGEILNKIYNNAVPSEIEYFPSNVESDANSQVPEVDALLDQEMDTNAVSAMSRFMIERVSGGKVRIKSYDAQLGEYFDSMSNTASKLPILKRFQAVFNKENSNLISSYYGKNTTDELRENIGRYITSRQQDSGLAKYISSGPFSKWLASGLGVQMVFAFTSAFSQLSSTPGPILSYGVKNYLDGLLMLTSGEVNARRAIVDLTDGSLFRERFGSRIEVADIVKAIPSDETGFASYVNEINKKLISIGAIPSSAFDALSIILSLPIYAREYSNALKTMTRKEAADYAENVLMDKAENFLQSKSDEMMSSFESKHRTTLYAFATVVPQLQRQAIMAFKRIQRGEGDLAQNINVLVWSGIGSSVAFRLLRPYFESLFEGDDDDEELKKLRDDKRLKRTTIDLAVDATKSLGTWGAISAGVLKTAYQLAEAEGDASVARRALDITPEVLEFVPAVSIKVSSINNAIKSYYDDEDLRGTTQAIQALTNIPAEKARGLAVQMSDAFLIDQFTLGERLTRLAGFVSENKAKEKIYQKSISTNPEMRELLSPSEIQRFESKQKSEYKSATSVIAKQYSEATTQQDRDVAMSKLFSLQASTTKYSAKESGELIQQIQDDFDNKVVENSLPEGFLEIKRMPSTKKVNFVANEFNKIKDTDEALSYVESLYMYGVISENERGEVFDILLQTKTKQ